MIKKEVLEIRKQFTPENCSITRMCGCYVDYEKNKKVEMKQAFLSLPEDEAFKYFDIFKQTLSGTIGKNMLNMEFPLEQEMPGGTQEFLLKLRNDKLQDDMMIEEFYDKVIENFAYGENYYIVLIHVTYDIPGKSSDGMAMFDASDDVYEYLLCSICPVNLSKAGLSYNEVTNNIEDRTRDWIVEAPIKGFLFPVFNDRNVDIHNVLYYTKKAEDIQPEFIEQLLGSRIPLTADNQKETFHNMIVETLGDECDYDIVKSIHENLNEIIEESKEILEPLELSKKDLKRLFQKSGVSEEKMESFEDDYKEVLGENATLLASNIAETKKLSIETPDVIIKVNPQRTDLVETRVIDNRQYLVIAIDDYVELNGIIVKPQSV